MAGFSLKNGKIKSYQMTSSNNLKFILFKSLENIPFQNILLDGTSTESGTDDISGTSVRLSTPKFLNIIKQTISKWKNGSRTRNLIELFFEDKTFLNQIMTGSCKKATGSQVIPKPMKPTTSRVPAVKQIDYRKLLGNWKFSCQAFLENKTVFEQGQYCGANLNHIFDTDRKYTKWDKSECRINRRKWRKNKNLNSSKYIVMFKTPEKRFDRVSCPRKPISYIGKLVVILLPSSNLQ